LPWLEAVLAASGRPIRTSMGLAPQQPAGDTPGVAAAPVAFAAAGIVPDAG
jgi:hypothetical protein